MAALAAALTATSIAAAASPVAAALRDAAERATDAGIIAPPNNDAVSSTPAIPDRIGVLVLEVVGSAQVRSDRVASSTTDTTNTHPHWTTLETGMVLRPGAAVRTGIRSHAVLRLGLNATVRINSLSRVELTQLDAAPKPNTKPNANPDADNATLTTRLLLNAGDVDVRVDHIEGYDNDFEILTPQATLAVRGTNFSAGIDALQGLRVQGARTNDLRAIELRYLRDAERIDMSRGEVFGAYRQPAFAALAAAAAGPNQGIDIDRYGQRIGSTNDRLAGAAAVLAGAEAGGALADTVISNLSDRLDTAGDGG